MAIKIIENKGKHFTRLRMESTDEEEINAAVEAYESRYLPMGYATKIESAGTDPQGVHFANITRYSSCD